MRYPGIGRGPEKEIDIGAFRPGVASLDAESGVAHDELKIRWRENVKVLVPEFMPTKVVGDGAGIGDFNEGDAFWRKDGTDRAQKLKWMWDMLECVAAYNGPGWAVFLQDGGSAF